MDTRRVIPSISETKHFRRIFTLSNAIAVVELDAWEKRLAEKGIAVESKVKWERGGQSLYFRDPDGNLLELITPGAWTIY